MPASILVITATSSHGLGTHSHTHTHTHTPPPLTHRAGFQSLRGGGISSLLLRGATPRAACMMVMNFLYFMLLLSNALASQQCVLVKELPQQPLSWLPTVGPPFLSLGVCGCSAEEPCTLSGAGVEKSQKTKRPCTDLC